MSGPPMKRQKPMLSLVTGAEPGFPAVWADRAGAAPDMTEGVLPLADPAAVAARLQKTKQEKQAEREERRHLEEERNHRLSAQHVTQRILSQLMVEGGLPLFEITKGLPDASKELVQSVLEVLQTMGIVTHLKIKPSCLITSDGSLMEATSLAAATGCNAEAVAAINAGNGNTIYFLSSLAKTPESVDLRGLPQAILVKKQNAEKIRSRCVALHALSSRPNARPERIAELKTTFAELVAKEPSLQDDALYRTLLESARHK